MEFAVIYQSKSGNTKKIAEAIFESLDTESKTICNIDMDSEIPVADFYFIGFGVHNMNCGMDIIELFEEVEGKNFAVFATCGFVPTDHYREQIEKNITIWFPDDTEYYGMYLCQGNVESFQRTVMIGKMPLQEQNLKKMFSSGSSHPDTDDISGAVVFSKQIQQMY